MEFGVSLELGACALGAFPASLAKKNFPPPSKRKRAQADASERFAKLRVIRAAKNRFGLRGQRGSRDTAFAQPVTPVSRPASGKHRRHRPSGRTPFAISQLAFRRHPSTITQPSSSVKQYIHKYLFHVEHPPPPPPGPCLTTSTRLSSQAQQRLPLLGNLGYVPINSPTSKRLWLNPLDACCLYCFY